MLMMKHRPRNTVLRPKMCATPWFSSILALVCSLLGCWSRHGDAEDAGITEMRSQSRPASGAHCTAGSGPGSAQAWSRDSGSEKRLSPGQQLHTSPALR